MHVYLRSDRLLLRRFEPADVDALADLDGDPAVMRYINGGRPTPRGEIETDFLPAFLDYYRRGDRFGFWAAIGTDSGNFLGWFHLRPEPGHGVDDDPELGYRLVRSAWGNGYAAEGSRALVDKAFRDLGARRVHATTMTVNRASRRVMEKAGLRLVRTYFQEWADPIPGGEHGDVEYAITREEWSSPEGRQPA